MKMARSSCSRSTTTCPWHGNFDCKESFQYASPSKPEEQELVRQELNEDGKIKLFEIYKDMSMAREFSTAWKASSTPVPVTRRSRSSKISRVGAADLVGQMLTIVISYLFFHWVYRSYSQVQR